MSCHCFIVPTDVLVRFSKDKKLSPAARKAFANAVEFESHWRKLRAAQAQVSMFAQQTLASGATLAAAPVVTVYDCAKGTALPGAPSDAPESSADATCKRVCAETSAVAEFFREVFGRNSLDNRGMTLQSSIHYGVDYNNAFWNGAQMTYGDGDGKIFLDFTLGTEVIGHELSHGLTQHSAQLSYENEAGGLNESISDVFGSMFRQWRKNQTVSKADWLIGRDIMGPIAKGQGYTCLRDLRQPEAKHCLTPQPAHYSKLKAGMESHITSGVPNLAFYKAARSIGGRSWEIAGRIWYRALTGYAPSPRMKMKTFAARTRKLTQTLYPTKPRVFACVDQAWKDVGL